jgi:mannose-1-phosphate guanylyltransferase
MSLAFALAENGQGAEAIHYLGIRPDTADPELGYIVRGEPLFDGSYSIARFVEKPSRDVAANLLQRRALWNSFILVARAAALVALIERRHPNEAAAFASLWRRAPQEGLPAPAALDALYATLPEIDFSRGVVEGTRAPLRVVPVPYCGWSDLGTPERVASCLDRFESRRVAAASRHFNLADACARLAGSMAVAEQSV